MDKIEMEPIASSDPVLWDGHTHTHFCPHGDGRHLELYIHRAVNLGLKRYSVTEHPPLPANWITDANLQAELCIEESDLNDYFNTVGAIRDEFSDRIEIRRGLELDYLHVRESFTTDLIALCGPRLEEAIVSVHFLPGRGGNRCIDYTPADVMEGLVSYHGSMEAVVHLYYDHLEQAILFASSLPLPVRMGHINLIEKFRHALPPVDPELLRHRQDGLLALLAKSVARPAPVGIDVNMAGLRKDTCGKPYVEEWFMKACLAQGTPCVFGSDAHNPADVGAGIQTMRKWMEQAGG